MWTTQEIIEIARTFNGKELSEVLTTEELAVIPSSALVNIRSRIIEPKHKHPVI